MEAPSEIRKDFFAPDFYLNCFFCLCFFLLFNKIILLLILLTQTRQFRVLFYCEELCLSKIGGGASQLAMLTFNNSPITRLVGLKCGSARELVVSVTLNSVRQTTAKVCALHLLVDLAGMNSTLQAHGAHSSVTIYIYIYTNKVIKKTLTILFSFI